MIGLEGGTFQMGSNRHYPEEGPARLATVAPFAIDPTPVTNADFAAFVAATGYVTCAERVPVAADYPGADPALLVPGSAVFVAPPETTRARSPADWWTYRPGAHWRVPQADGLPADPSHPVVHIALEDAEAYAAWAGKSLPTEEEWEFAARGGLDGAAYAWGDEFMPGGVPRANTWHGIFPFRRELVAEGVRTSPVHAYPPNGFGLFDMIGNVWEWTVTRWQSRTPPHPCCRLAAPERTPLVIKGGSHLCAPSYCRRYRPASRQPQSADGATSHLGFRCVRR